MAWNSKFESGQNSTGDNGRLASAEFHKDIDLAQPGANDLQTNKQSISYRLPSLILVGEGPNQHDWQSNHLRMPESEEERYTRQARQYAELCARAHRQSPPTTETDLYGHNWRVQRWFGPSEWFGNDLPTPCRSVQSADGPDDREYQYLIPSDR